MTLTLRYAARSDRGLIRDGNQDSVYAGPRLLAVADGMGGMAAGDIASNIVIGALAPLDDDVPGADLVDVLRRAVAAANQQLRDAVDENPQLEGMGTTLTSMLFSGSRFALGHVGDSRAYLLRDGVLAQITKDDSYVQMLVDEGRITQEEASSHPQRSLLTRALDGRDVEPEFSLRDGVPGDRYMLCSDGLSGVVSQETIEDTLNELPDPHQCVDRLVQLALRGGGPDNVTVIVADVTDHDIVEDRPVVGGAAARDRGMATAADPTSAAARAAAASVRPVEPVAEVPDEDAEEAPGKPHRVRNSLVLLVLLVLLGTGGWYGWRYTQSQYYVGATSDGHVAVFRGVPGQLVGLRMSSVDVQSPTELTDLTRVARNRVRDGIPAKDRHDAQRILTDLTSEDPGNQNLLPPCPLPSQSQSQSPGNTSTSASPTPRTTPRATGKPSPRATASASAGATGSPTGSATMAGTPSPSSVQESPDCRPDR